MADGPVRFAPSELPEGFELVAADEATDVPLPAVSTYEGEAGGFDDVSVRIVADPLVTSDRLATMATGLAGAEGADTTLPPGTVSAGPTGSLAITTTTTVGSVTTSTTAAPTTTTMPPALGALNLVLDPLGEGIEIEALRGSEGGVEVHDDTSTTVWFRDEGGPWMAVDVAGADRSTALEIVEGLVPRAGGNGLEPAASSGLTPVDDLPAATSESTAGLRYEIPGPDESGAMPLVVTSIALPSDRRDLLTATAGWSGGVTDWDGRQVLVDTVDASTGIRGGMAAFVDPSGVLVIVQGPVDDLRSTVDSLEMLDDEAWASMTGGVVASSSSEPPTTEGPNGTGGDPSTTTPGETTGGTGGPTTTALAGEGNGGDGGASTTTEVTFGVPTTQPPDSTTSTETEVTPPPTGGTTTSFATH
jgi:hypothetical protein